MNIDRRQLALPVLALGLMSVVPAFAGADEDAVAKNVEAFRAAQQAGPFETAEDDLGNFLRRSLLERCANRKGNQHREREFRHHVSSPAI